MRAATMMPMTNEVTRIVRRVAVAPELGISRSMFIRPMTTTERRPTAANVGAMMVERTFFSPLWVRKKAITATLVSAIRVSRPRVAAPENQV